MAWEPENVVDIGAFGKWHVSVNGVDAESIKSRHARQLLVAFSLDGGAVSREQLIDELWSTAPDHGKARRRLTKELSRIQSYLGISVWSADRETVRVDPSVNLISDVGRFIHAVEATTPLEGRVPEAARLEEHLRAVERGLLLPGHFDPWTCDLRTRVEYLETRVRRSLVELLGASDGMVALRHARRWAELDPFADDAHAAVIHLTKIHLGSVAADQYRAQTEKLYREELNVDPAFSVDGLAATVMAPPSGPTLPCKADRLKQRLRDEDLRCHDRITLLLELDDVLRLTGHNHQRAKLLSDLEELGVGLDIRGWREAEVATAIGDIDRVRMLAEGIRSTTRTRDDAPTSMIDLIEARGLHVLGRNAQAIERVEAMLAGAVPVNVEIEARQLLATAYDAAGKVEAAREQALQALEEVWRANASEYEAAALAEFGYSLARGIYAAEAEVHVERAHQLAQASGSDQDMGAVYHASAYIHYISRRFTVSYSYASAAARCYHRCGDLYKFARSAYCAGLTARIYGDLSAICYQLDALWASSELNRLPLVRAQREVLESFLHSGERRFEQSANCLVSALDRLRDVELNLLMSFVTSMLIRSRLFMGQADAALELARANITRVQDLGFPPRQVEWMQGDLGCALVATGQVRQGLDVLNGFLGHGNPSQILFALPYAYRFEAARSLGEHETAEATRRTAWYMLETLRTDLTPDQWIAAKQHSDFVRPLLSVVDNMS